MEKPSMITLFFLVVFVFLKGSAVSATDKFKLRGVCEKCQKSDIEIEIAQAPMGTVPSGIPHKAKLRGVREKCDKSDIQIAQAPVGTMPNGIPQYTVEISNTCARGCIISNIHVSCRAFSSVRLVNPKLFRRLRYDDCLVNDGKPLLPGHAISFVYANTFSYPLAISSVVCN